MDRNKFLETQQQFYFAVLEFPRAMLSLLANFPHPSQRLGILENVVEEHGRFQPEAFHEATFRQFLEAIREAEYGVRNAESQTELETSQPDRGPVVDAFNCALMAACHFEPVEVGTACLGIIELAFADISAMIGQAVVQHGWVPVDELVHYKLHAEIDKGHAADMFAVLEPLWNNRTHRANIERGLQLGAHLFDRLYRDLDRCHHAARASALKT
jgi:pyrroloquinoline-quinone synthase